MATTKAAIAFGHARLRRPRPRQEAMQREGAQRPRCTDRARRPMALDNRIRKPGCMRARGRLKAGGQQTAPRFSGSSGSAARRRGRSAANHFPANRIEANQRQTKFFGPSLPRHRHALILEHRLMFRVAVEKRRDRKPPRQPSACGRRYAGIGQAHVLGVGCGFPGRNRRQHIVSVPAGVPLTWEMPARVNAVAPERWPPAPWPAVPSPS
jgi:hypothetical protein